MLTNPIIDKAFESIFGNFGQALKIGLVPIVLAAAVFGILNYQLIGQLMAAQGETVVITSVQIVCLIAGMLSIIYAGTYSAVRWHCFSLAVPENRQDNFKRPFLYFLMSLGLCIVILLLIVVVVLLPSSLFLGGQVNVMIGDFSGALQLGWPHVVINAIATFAFVYLFLRWAAWRLVGYATGMARTVGKTIQTANRDIIHIAILYTVATFIWTLTGFAGLPWFVALPLDLAFTWLAFMFSIAVMTEVYRVVEGDALMYGAEQGATLPEADKERDKT